MDMDTNKVTSEDGSIRKKIFKCTACKKTFSHKESLYRHKKSGCGLLKAHVCPRCSKDFGRKDALKRHLDTCPGRKKVEFICKTCRKSFRNNWFLMRHEKTHENKCSRCRKVKEEGHVCKVLIVAPPIRKKKIKKKDELEMEYEIPTNLDDLIHFNLLNNINDDYDCDGGDFPTMVEVMHPCPGPGTYGLQV